MNICAAMQEELEESDEESNSDNDGSKQSLESTLTDHESKEHNKAASSKRQSKVKYMYVFLIFELIALY